MTEIDFIGDIHGHADELAELLEGQLGYELQVHLPSSTQKKTFF